MLFSEATLDDLRRVPGSSHSFARHLAEPDGEAIREWLEAATADAPAAARARWCEVLTSLDNRRFFQGFAEVATTAHLSNAGWTLDDLQWPGPGLSMVHRDGRQLEVLVLSFIRQVRPGPDAAMTARLRRALDRVGSRSRIAVLVRRWLPHDFDPEPVRRAIDLWLREVDRGGWDGRYAAYDDDHVSLEFALTGEKAEEDQPVVAFVLGPFEAQRTLEAVEQRVVAELDRSRLQNGPSDRPTVVALVGDQPFRISEGYLREFFFGKPTFQITDPDRPGLELWYGQRDSPCLFRDPHSGHVAGVLKLERPDPTAAAVDARAWLNPWSHVDLSPADVGAPSVHRDRVEGDFLVLRNVVPR